MSSSNPEAQPTGLPNDTSQIPTSGEPPSPHTSQPSHLSDTRNQVPSEYGSSQAPYQQLPPYGEAASWQTSQIQHGAEYSDTKTSENVLNAIEPIIDEVNYSNALDKALQSSEEVPLQSNALGPPALPPRRPSYGGEDSSSPAHYTRDPHRLIAYLVPFPKPSVKDVDSAKIPDRFLIYTPPPPPLSAPPEGEKEGYAHKIQRKWEQEVREAKFSDAKVASWKGVKSRATKGINWAMGSVKGSSLDFLNRVPATSKEAHPDTEHDEKLEGEATKKTVGLEEMVLVYPSSVPGSEDELRTEFVNSMLRTKSKAQRDAIIATGLMPVAFGIDVLATLVWPFGGLVEIDGVWAFASLRGAKTARSVTKRLNSTNSGDDTDSKTDSGPQLKLTFTPSSRLDIMSHYLAAECHKRDSKLFPQYITPPIESDVISAIGWAPSQTGGETRNWEDEQWELTEVKDDFRNVMHKGAKEWDKWCKAFEKNPEKALKK
ncbi:MAG: hypothetical protein Q9227_002159 [Pyrenula ochraceoflavens]